MLMYHKVELDYKGLRWKLYDVGSPFVNTLMQTLHARINADAHTWTAKARISGNIRANAHDETQFAIF